MNDRPQHRNILCLITLVLFPGKLPLLHFVHLEIGKVACDFGTQRTTTLTHRQWTCCADFYTAVMNGRWRKRTSSAFYRYNPDKAKTGVLPPTWWDPSPPRERSTGTVSP